MSIVTDRASLYCRESDKDFIEGLIGAEEPEMFIFEDRLDAFFILACLGYAARMYEPFEQGEKRHELSLSSYYAERESLILVLAALAFEGLRERERDEPSAELIAESLSRFTKIIPLVEGWVNGGVRYLQQQMSSGSLSQTGTMGLAELISTQIEEQMRRL